jgi:hypothetical protein
MILMEFLTQLDKEDQESDSPQLIQNIIETCSNEVQTNCAELGYATTRLTFLTTCRAMASEVSSENREQYLKLVDTLLWRSTKQGVKDLIWGTLKSKLGM